MPRRSSRNVPANSVPNRPSSPVPPTETDDLAEFKEKLEVPDETLTSMSNAEYKAWLRAMFAGLAGLVQKRYAALTLHRKARFDRWCTDWELQVEKLSPELYLNREKSMLWAKMNFAYLDRVLQDPKDWYLVSMSLVGTERLKLTG